MSSSSEPAPMDSLELADLPVEAMDTEALEARVLRDVQQKAERRELEETVERGSREAAKLQVSLTEAREAWGNAEGELQEAGRMGERRLMRLMKEREKWKEKMDKAEARLGVLSNEVEEAKEELERRDREDEEGAGLEDGEVPEPPTRPPEDETEEQRKIRLGQVTAFGKEVTSKTNVEESSGGLLVSREMREIKREGKKKGKRKIEMRPMSDDSEGEDRGRDTDESSWESDEESALRKKRRRLGLDDGERENFIFRLEELEECGEMKQLFASSEELEAGLHVPKVLWDKLFSYQKVSQRGKNKHKGTHIRTEKKGLGSYFDK